MTLPAAIGHRLVWAGPQADHEGMEAPATSPHEAMGHGDHAAMSMGDMARGMRNRFLIATQLSVPILLWSPIEREVTGFETPAPFGLCDDGFGLLRSLPIISSSA